VLNTNTNADITGIAFKNDTVGCISTADGKCIVTGNGGTTWTSYSTGMSALTSALWIPGNGIYVTGPNGAILKSTNNGQSWSPMSTGTTETINSIGVEASTGKGYAVGTNGKLMTFNGGTSWNPVTSPTSQSLNSVAVSGSGKAVAVGQNGTVLRTTDFGATWNPLSVSVPRNLRQVLFADSVTGFIAADNGVVYMTSNGGASWTVSLTGVDVNFVSIASTRTGDTAWAASNSGVIYKTTNRGVSWARFSKGSTNDNTGSTYRSSRGYITGKGGDLRMFQGNPDTTNISVNDISSVEHELSIYPNPAKDVVTISFDVDGAQPVTMKIVDVQGRVVIRKTTENAFDSYEKTISVSTLKPGVYFVHIETGSENIVSRFVITR
jgi:photosystem II stability/assembly factor-like uncharacterized protein